MAASDAQQKIFSSILETIESVSDRQFENYLREDYRIGTQPPSNPFTGHFYTGVNRFHLSILNIFGIKDSTHYGTFKQITQAGGSLKKGSRGIDIIVSIKRFADAKTGKKVYESVYNRMDENEKKNVSVFSSAKTIKVFSFDDIKDTAMLGISIPDNGQEQAEVAFAYREEIEMMVAGTGCVILTKNLQTAYYDTVSDTVAMPPESAFVNSDHYYCTLFHELVHFTGPRLGRNMGGKEVEYSFEELVAESGSLLLCMEYGITSLIVSSCAYMKSYLHLASDARETALEALHEGSRAAHYLQGSKNKKEAA